MHTDVCNIALVARNAVVENSNGNNKGRFKHSKHDKTHIVACKDPAIVPDLHHYAMQSRSQAAKMIDQLRSLQQPVVSYIKITDSDISKVMDDNPTPDDSMDKLVSGIRRLRGEYHLITDHSMTFIQEKIKRFVQKFIKDLIDLVEHAKSWICEDATIVKNLMLRDYEMMGTTTEYKGCPKPTE